jgi:hypothetical protein
MTISKTPHDYELTFDERPGYLFAHITASQMTAEMALSYLSRIAARATVLHSTRVAIERDVPVMLPPGDLFFTTAKFLEMIRGVRVAFINPHAAIEDEMRFAIMIGTNRGADYKVVNSVAAAEEWLFAQ